MCFDRVALRTKSNPFFLGKDARHITVFGIEHIYNGTDHYALSRSEISNLGKRGLIYFRHEGVMALLWDLKGKARRSNGRVSGASSEEMEFTPAVVGRTLRPL
jgi:hypothetical protein